MNNTIAGNYGRQATVYFSGTTAGTFSNNIVAFNFSGIFRYSGSVTLRNNCVYGNTAYNYSGLAADPTGTGGT